MAGQPEGFGRVLLKSLCLQQCTLPHEVLLKFPSACGVQARA